MIMKLCLIIFLPHTASCNIPDPEKAKVSDPLKKAGVTYAAKRSLGPRNTEGGSKACAKVCSKCDILFSFFKSFFLKELCSVAVVKRFFVFASLKL